MNDIQIEATAMTLAEAVRLVAADQNQYEDSMTLAESIDHARNTLTTPEQGRMHGGSVVESDGEPLTDAYLAVLRATPAELIAAEASVVEADAPFVLTTFQQRVLEQARKDAAAKGGRVTWLGTPIVHYAIVDAPHLHEMVAAGVVEFVTGGRNNDIVYIVPTAV